MLEQTQVAISMPNAMPIIAAMLALGGGMQHGDSWVVSYIAIATKCWLFFLLSLVVLQPHASSGIRY